MKVLFFARHFTYMRNFESVLRELARRGHAVHVAAERDESFGGREMIDRLSAQYPAITAGWAPERTDGWERLAMKLRLALDYLRYLEPAYEKTPRLRLRAEERVPALLLQAMRMPPFRGAAGRRRLARLLTRWEQAIPIDDGIRRFIEEQRPDAVLITPLIGVVKSPQLDYLYAAQALGLPTGLCVWSWDHLSSKALIRRLPDRVLVWNGTQQREAVELHGVPADRVVVTGAQCFDQWFDRAPSRDRAAFCRRIGLRDDRPYLLWVCSALFRGSPEEAGFVQRWVEALRASGHPALRDVNIVIRPHPSRRREWERVDLRAVEGVTLWGDNPVTDDARADYFDSLYHASAVIGLNTSAFIEAGIVGRPVYTVLLPEFHENQEATLHFHYLLTVAGGLLHTSRSLDEHASQLAALLAGEAAAQRNRPFVEAFVRPHGLSQAATPIVADTVEQLAALRPSVAVHDRVTGVPVPVRLAAAFERSIGHALMLDARERVERRTIEAATTRKAAERDVKVARKAQARDEKAARRAARARHKQQRLGRRRRDKLWQLVREKAGLTSSSTHR